MFRSFFVFLSKANWAKNLFMKLGFVRKMASRFIAGEGIEDAIQAIRALNSQGMNASLDHLGENTSTASEARQATQEILTVIDTIYREKVKSNVSIKLSQIGFTLSMELCADNLKTILKFAKERGIFVRIDMEDSSTVDDTLKLYFQMRQAEHLNLVGLVIQAYLYRSEQDIQKLGSIGTSIRLCKGAYKEPAEVAFPKKVEVDANYDRLTKQLMDIAFAHQAPTVSPDGHVPPIPAIATHDEKRIQYAQAYAQEINLSSDAYEFQMLYGIRRDLQNELSQKGYKVRIYIPYGTQWYPYFMRRLGERPANLWFILSNLLRK